MIGREMWRRGLWWLALPLAVAGWLSARWAAHLLHAPDAHETAMTGYGALHLCGACVLMLVVLVVLVLGRPVMGLGFRHRLELLRAPRPRGARSGPLRLVLVGPELPQPSILACGHVVRAPPAAPAPV